MEELVSPFIKLDACYTLLPRVLLKVVIILQNARKYLENMEQLYTSSLKFLISMSYI